MAVKRSQYVTEELQYLLVIITALYDCYKSLARSVRGSTRKHLNTTVCSITKPKFPTYYIDACEFKIILPVIKQIQYILCM